MKVKFNQEWVNIPSYTVLSDLIEIFDVKERYYAIALNGEFISRHFYKSKILKDLDEVDIIIPMQGG